MSWLLGDYFKARPSAGGAGGNVAGPPDGAEVVGEVPEEGKKWVGFDPTGLERAAKAARELNQSR